MSDDIVNTGDNIVNIDIDIPEDLICDLFRAHLSIHMDPPSYSIVEDALKFKERKGMSHIYEAVGRAVLNQIMEDAIKDKLLREQWMEKLDNDNTEV